MIKICEVNGCERPVYGFGKRGSDESITRLCRKHYRWLKERGSTLPTKFSRGTLIERFKLRLAEIDKPENGCWIWMLAKNSKGYGFIGERVNDIDKMRLAHRVSYQYHYGDLDDSDVVLHSCDNPSCINPAHLKKGTQSENIQDAFDKGRKKQPILFGEHHPKSKLTLENVEFIRANPQMMHTELAVMFGVKPNTIRGVRIGRTWK
jgi:hypothetical protein